MPDAVASSADAYYHTAFSRNLGLISSAEQEVLRRARVAIVGMGGMGGVQAATLARTGIGRFSLADPDIFDVVNVNRQYGATTQAFGQNKAAAMAEIVRSINPGAELRIFEAAIDESNVDDFLDGANLVIDALDLFAPRARRLIYRAARQKGIYVVAAGPIGFSGTLFVFAPDGMSADEYFGLTDGMTDEELLLAFLTGLVPLRRDMLAYMDLSAVDPGSGVGPSLALATQIAAGMAAGEVIRVLLGRGGVKAAPHSFQFDVYTRRFHQRYLRWGAKNPMQRLRRRAWGRLMARFAK